MVMYLGQNGRSQFYSLNEVGQPDGQSTVEWTRVGKLVCDRCGRTYTDDESIRSAQRGFENWKALCEKDGVAPRGLSPCPILPCPGELILKTD